MKTSLTLYARNILTTIFSCQGIKEERDPTLIAKDDSLEDQKLLKLIIEPPEHVTTPEGMVWIPGGKFIQEASGGT